VALYSYECTECGKQTEIMKPMSECDKTEFCTCGAQLRMLPASVSKFVRGKGGWSSPA
jgi:putative FmdB family regulatory protein